MVKTYPPEIDAYCGNSKENQERKDDRIKFMRERLKQMHDKYHPQAIFVTQTSATLYGWTIKELWKKAWPNEKVPKVFTIDVRPIVYKHVGEKLTGSEEGFKEYVDYLRDFAENSIAKYNLAGGDAEEEFVQMMGMGSKCFDKFPTRESKVKAVLKEAENPTYTKYSASHLVINNRSEFESIKKRIEENIKKSKISGNICIVDEGTAPGPEYYHDTGLVSYKTLGMAEKILQEVKKDGYLVGTIKSVGLSQTPWFPKSKKGPWRRVEGDNTNYKRVNNSEDRKEALERIQIYKQFGRELGEELYQELEHKKSLENKLSAIVGIAGIGLGLFFILSNFSSGNVQLSPGTNSFNWKLFSGIGLIIVGVIAGLFYSMRRI